MARRAFILIELLVVVAIIAVLVAILLPAMQQARHAAQRTVCASKWRQIGILMTYYHQDSNGMYPRMGGGNGGEWRAIFWWGSPRLYVGFGVLQPYLARSEQYGDWLGDVGANVPGNMYRRGIFSDLTCTLSTGYGDWCNVLYVLPFCAENSMGGAGATYPFVPKLEDHEFSRTTLGVCYIAANPWVPDRFRTGAHSGAGFSVLRLDGHAAWIPQERVLDAGLLPDTCTKMKYFNGD